MSDEWEIVTVRLTGGGDRESDEALERLSQELDTAIVKALNRWRENNPGIRAGAWLDTETRENQRIW
jgi:hypothetical protein